MAQIQVKTFQNACWIGSVFRISREIIDKNKLLSGIHPRSNHQIPIHLGRWNEIICLRHRIRHGVALFLYRNFNIVEQVQNLPDIPYKEKANKRNFWYLSKP